MIRKILKTKRGALAPKDHADMLDMLEEYSRQRTLHEQPASPLIQEVCQKLEEHLASDNIALAQPDATAPPEPAIDRARRLLQGEACAGLGCKSPLGL